MISIMPIRRISKNRWMRQGLPQGAVLSPILFLFYINNLANSLPEDTLASLFADDVSILSSNTDRNEAVNKAQKAVDVVTKWAKEWKLTLNTTKSEASFFSTWVGETRWKQEIKVNGKQIKFNSNTTFSRIYIRQNIYIRSTHWLH